MMDLGQLTPYLPLIWDFTNQALKWYGENRLALDGIIALLLMAGTYLIKDKAYRSFFFTAFQAAQKIAQLALKDEDRRTEYEKQVYATVSPWVRKIITEKSAIDIIENVYQTLTTLPIVVQEESKKEEEQQ